MTLTETWQSNGKYYGYPRCCIDSFCSRNRINKDQSKAHQNTGFIPCPEHAKLIVSGELKLSDLIKNRVCKDPFNT